MLVTGTDYSVKALITALVPGINCVTRSGENPRIVQYNMYLIVTKHNFVQFINVKPSVHSPRLPISVTRWSANFCLVNYVLFGIGNPGFTQADC